LRVAGFVKFKLPMGEPEGKASLGKIRGIQRSRLAGTKIQLRRSFKFEHYALQLQPAL